MDGEGNEARGKIGEGLDRIKWKNWGNGEWSGRGRSKVEGKVGNGRKARLEEMGWERSMKSGMQVQVREWVILAGPSAIRYRTNEDEHTHAHLEEPSSFNRRTHSE